MRSYRYRFVIIGLSLLAAFPASANMGLDLTRQYFDFLTSGNIESASYMWRSESRERAEKFGISYDGIPLKMDCNSPLVRSLDYLKMQMISDYARVEGGLNDGFVKVLFGAKVGTIDTIGYTYYAYNDGKYLWLTYPQDYYARNWEITKSEFFRVHVHPDRKSRINPVILDAADAYIRQMADSLELTPEDVALLASKKIDYYYCDTNTTVDEIAQADAEGTFDMPSDDIISAQFPHYHELVHFLVAFKLRKLPLYTLPILREGVAVMYGGRWGKSPSSLYGLAAFLYKQQLVEFDSLLTLQGFQSSSAAEVNYPVAGLLSCFIKQKLGLSGYLKVYRALSGDYDGLHVLTPELAKSRLANAADYPDWAAFKTDFDKFVDSYESSYAAASPGDAGGKQLLKSPMIEVKESADWVTLIAKGNEQQAPVGTLLFGSDKRMKGYSSPLYELQFGGTPFGGYRYALRWDTNEAGLYDYATNQISAKYIFGLAPDSTYYSEKDQTISVKFRKTLFNGALPHDGDVQFLEQ